jgi:hypothetical protein
MATLYWIVLGAAGVAIIAFYAVSLRAPRSFSFAGGKRSKWTRRVGLALLIVVLVAIYVWLFRRMFE